eukprot:7629027-Ditylum_brightwellii.AAC.1
MVKVITDVMVELGASHHRLLILPCVCLMGRIWRQSTQTAHSVWCLSHVEGGKKFDCGIGSRSSHTVHSSWYLRSQKGDKNCHRRTMSSLSQSIKSQTRLSASRSSNGQ